MQRLSLKDIFDNLIIIQTDTSNWKRNLMKETGKTVSETATPIKNILDLVKNLGCQSVVIEKEYVDADYLEEYSDFYSRSFRDYSSKSIRLHFFGDKINYQNLVDLSDKRYLGYSVVRPIGSFRTGRTILISPYHDGDRYFTLCKDSFGVNLSGNNLKVCAMPFIQQDTNINVCAQATLWMTHYYMHKRFGYPRFTPPEITRLATKYMTIGPVRRGLHVNQMLAALREMGYSPVVFTNYSPSDTTKIIYSYVESEIPVILTLKLPNGEGHAIVIIGHDYNVKNKLTNRERFNIGFIDHFYYHDDAEGPYRKLNLKRHGYISIRDNVTHVLVPSPKEITMQIDDVLKHIIELVDINILNNFTGLFKDAEKCKFSAKEIYGLVFRTYLRRSNDFKNNLPNEMSEFFRLKYKAMRMPKYVWVTELSRKELLNLPLSKNRKIFGEIIIDSTADRHARFESFLAIHLLGRMLIRKPEEHFPFELLFDSTEEPYQHLVRRPKNT